MGSFSPRLAIDFCSGALGVALKLKEDSEPIFVIETHGSSLKDMTRLIRLVLDHTGARLGDIQELALASGPGRLMGIKASFAFAFGLKEAFGEGLTLFGMNRLDALAYFLPPQSNGWVVLESHGQSAAACRYSGNDLWVSRASEPVMDLKENLINLVGQEECLSDSGEFRFLPKACVLDPEGVTRRVLSKLVSCHEGTLYFYKDPKPFFLRPLRSLRSSGRERVVF